MKKLFAGVAVAFVLPVAAATPSAPVPCRAASTPTAHLIGQAAPASPHLDSALMAWLPGSWSGEGAFANGATITAKLSVRLSLDSAWLVFEHRDVSPHKYAATSYWGVDAATGQQLCYTFDNFKGHRSFTGNGWQSDSIVWQCQSWRDKVGVYYEHFIYRRLDERQFKMTYETSRDGINWKMVDYLIFTKAVGG